MNTAELPNQQLGKNFALACALFLAAAVRTDGAVVLSGNAYAENFDNLASGLPTGWEVYTGATSGFLGNVASFVSTPTSWGTATGNFRNAASSEGLFSTAPTDSQSGSLDRALAVRQVSESDPGAAFVLEIANTAGFQLFNIQMKAQMLSVQPRSTTWTFDYRIGNTADFTSLGTYTDPGAFGSTEINITSSALSAWNDQSSSIFFRVAALSASTGSGFRDTFGIDDFSLTFSAVPEPAEWGLISAVGLLGIAGFHSWQQSRRGKLASGVDR
jgi:hypothetical protein